MYFLWLTLNPRIKVMGSLVNDVIFILYKVWFKLISGRQGIIKLLNQQEKENKSCNFYY